MKLTITIPEEGYNFHVELNPATLVKSVLEVVCDRHDLNFGEYALSYRKTFLDNDELISNLAIPDDSILELLYDFRPKGSDCLFISLRVKDTLCSGYFNSRVSLWTVIENLVASETLAIPHSTPVLIHESIEYIGVYTLNELRLIDIGFYSGSVFFRFMLVDDLILSKRSGRLRSVDSLIYESGFQFLFKDFGSPSSTLLSMVDEEKVTFQPGVKARGSSILSEIHYLDEERKVVAFRIPENSMRPTSEKEDGFFSLRLSEVKALYFDLRKKRKDLEDRPFVTKQKRDELNKIREEAHTKTIIRVEFPDRTVLQGVFSPTEKVMVLQDFVLQYLRIPTSFCLFTAPPKEMLHPDKTLFQSRLVPTGKVFYKILEGEQPKSTAYLKEDVLRNLITHEAACHAAAQCRSSIPSVDNSSSSKSDSGSKTSVSMTSVSSSSSSSKKST